jgi:uncharacterized protein (TIGR00251 family)
MIREDGDSIVLHVLVEPKASEDLIVGFHGEVLKVKVTAPPAGGKANQRLKKILAKALNIRQSDIEIIRGHVSRRKVVRILNVTPDQLRNFENRRP